MNKTKADNLPESWIKITLSKILSENLQPGFAQNPKDGGDVGQIRTHNVSPDGSIDLNGLKFVFPSEKEFKKYTLRKGDIVFNNTNSDEWVGKTALYELEEEYLFSNHMTRIRVNTSLAEPEYIAKYLHFLWARGFSRSKSKQWVNQSGIEQSILASFPIPLPPLAEQKQIVAILQEADALRRKKKEILEKSNRLASALFLEMFGDPVRNEKGWELKRLGDFFLSARYGPRFYNEKYSEDGAHILRTTDMNKNGTIRWWEAPKMSVSEADIKKYALKPGTLIISRSGTIGPIAIFESSDTPCIAGAYLIEASLSEDINKEYVKYFLLSKHGQSALKKGGQAATQTNLNLPSISSIAIPLPPLPLQNDFAKKVEAIEETTKQIESNLQKMEKLYDSLLQKAFSGDLWFDKLTMTKVS